MSKTAVQKDQFPSQFEGLGRRFGMGACRLDSPQIQVLLRPCLSEEEKKKKLLTIPITIACAEPKWEKYQGFAQ